MRLIDVFDRGLMLSANAPCFVAPGIGSLTYAEVDELTHRVANGLRAAGVARGEHVGLLGSNHLFTFVAVLGILRAGAVWVPVNARNSLAENVNILAGLDCRFLFLDSEFAAAMPDFRAAMPQLRGAICVDTGAAGIEGLEDWSLQHSRAAVEADTRPEDVVAIRGTGGTTGLPRAVPNTNRMYAALFANWFACLPVSAPPIHLVVAPLTHAAGTMTFATLAQGGTNVIAPSADAQTILSLMEQYRVTQLFLPPTVIYRLLAHSHVRQFDFSALRYFIYSAAPMSAHKVREAMEVFGPVMVQLYGQAEAPFVCTCLSPADHAAARDRHEHRLASCGRPTPFVRVAIVGPDGAHLAVHERGEIVVRGDLVMEGYYRDAPASRAAVRNGWLHTGDVGYRDEDGFFYIVGRLKDLIISGGFNIAPVEIENVLMNHPGVGDCAVVGVPDDAWGEAVKGVVELKPGAAWDEREALAYCRDKLGAMKAPKSIEVWERLPRSRVGKVLKQQIRDTFWAGRDKKI